MESTLMTAGGKILCLRCTAHSSRTGAQCARPALKTSRTQKCQFHGGRASGPKTSEGRARISAAHTLHGQATKAARASQSEASAKISRLEDAVHLLKMTSAPRTKGRKASGYVPLKTLADVRDMMIDDLLHSMLGPFEQGQNNKRKTLHP
jgi:hypothetical protein